MPPTHLNLPHILSQTWTVRTAYSARDMITYNLSLGASGTDLSLVYESHPLFHALPTFGTLAVISAMSAVTASFPALIPGFRPEKHVHAEHVLELRRSFRVPEVGGVVELESQARILGLVKKGRGITVRVGISTKDLGGGGEVCWNEWTSFLLDVPGTGAEGPEGIEAAKQSKGTKSNDSLGTYRNSPPIAPVAPPSRPADRTLCVPTSNSQGALYRAASGDLNPLHIDPVVAARGGFPGPILTGTCTLGLAVKAILDVFAQGDAERFQGMRCRLSAPVFPGEDIRVDMWEEGERVVFRMVVGERVVLRDGVVLLRKLGARL